LLVSSLAKKPIPFIVLGMVSQASQKKFWQLPYFGTLDYLYSPKQWPFFSGWRCSKLIRPTQYIYHSALIKINANNMINDCTEHGVKTRIRCICCSKVLATLSKFRTSGGTRQKKHPSLRQPRNKKMTENRHLFAVPSLLTQKKCNSNSCIVLVVIYFLLSVWSLEVVPVV